MPSGFGGHELNQLESKDDIEDPVDLVKIEKPKTRRHRRLSHEGRSNAAPTQEETQNFPYHPSATVPSKGATKIGMPMSNSQPRKSTPITGVLRPGNNLYGNHNGSGSLKRLNTKLSVELHPRKQQKIIAVDQPSVDSDEIMEVSPTNYEEEEGAQPQEVRGFPKISKYFPGGRDSAEGMEENLSNKKELKGEEAFIYSVNELVKKKGPTSSSKGRWSSQGAESSRGGDFNRWSTTIPKRSIKPPREQYAKQCKTFRLLCLQTGVEFFSEAEDSPDLSIQIRILPHPGVECLQGKSKVRIIDLTDRNVIKKLYVNAHIRKFGIQTAQRVTTEPDRMVIFVLKDNEDVEDCISAFKNVGIKPTEVEEKTLDTMSNNLRDWVKRSQTAAYEPQDTEPTHQSKGHEKKMTFSDFRVEIPAPRRSSRTRACRAQNENSKRPRLSSMEGLEYSPLETHSPKPKLELPKPPWETPLVYPPTGPRKEIIDYDDLKRLNSNSYLNDNIINFYLKYIEVQLRHKSPEVAEETYFLNTFFYERLTKRDDKKKRDIDSVLKWTAKVDIFKTSYIIIPINESTHWYLAIICNLCNIERKINDKDLGSSEECDPVDLEFTETLTEPKSNGPDVFSTKTSNPRGATESLSMAREQEEEEGDLVIVATQDNLEHMAIDQEPSIEYEGHASVNGAEINNVDSSIDRSRHKSRGRIKAKNKSPPKKTKNAMPPDTPAIIILDSMGFGPTTHNGTFRNLRDWLVAEAQKKRNLKIDSGDIHAAFGKVPNQTNWYDCGLFLLHYVELFFEQPIEFTTLFLAKADRVSDTSFWRKEEIKGMREKLFHLFVQLHNDQVAELSKQTGNGDGSSSREMLEGSKRPLDADGSVKSEDMQETQISSDPNFEKFTGELGELITSGGGEGKGKFSGLVTEKAASQPIGPGEIPNSSSPNSPLQPNRRITLPLRNSHDGEGVVK